MGWLLDSIFGKPKRKVYYTNPDNEERKQQKILDANLNSEEKKVTKEGVVEESKTKTASYLPSEDKKPDSDSARSDKAVERQKRFIPIVKAKKDVIIFVIENTAMVNEYKNEILNLINKIVEGNKQSLFLFLRIGNSKKYFELMDYEVFTEESILKSLFTEDGINKTEVDYIGVLEHIHAFMLSCICSFKYKEIEYDLQSNNIIFVGAAECEYEESSKKEVFRLIKRIITRPKVKTVKYFCMEDNQTINAAALGFPVIGHIVTDFYK